MVLSLLKCGICVNTGQPPPLGCELSETGLGSVVFLPLPGNLHRWVCNTFVQWIPVLVGVSGDTQRTLQSRKRSPNQQRLRVSRGV